MCGICGIAQTDSGHPIVSSLISSMCETLEHRGPDDQGVHTEKNVGLGARRLSIIDLETGHQPLSNEDQTIWVSHNGEVYNFPSLREELLSRGHTFRTKTDTETIVHSYEEWGEEFVHKLRGMFAFALWDGRQEKLMLVRDRIGIKPLYYTLLEDKTLVFGSELKAILVHPAVERSLDPRALDLYLTLEYIPAPYSIFRSIHKLPAGNLLTYKKGRIHTKEYWELEDREKRDERAAKANRDAVMEELYALIKEAVQLRLISDVPLGAFLSGGIDSSSIVGLMHELGVSPIKTFSIGFEDASYDELHHARRIAEKFQTEHKEFVLQPDALDLTDKLIHHLDEPFGDFSIFPTYLVSKMARSHVKVILSGDGGDEVFGGYEHYQAQKLSRFPLPFLFRRIVHPFVRTIPPAQKKKGAWNKIRRFSQGFDNPPGYRHLRWMTFLTERDKNFLYAPEFQEELGGTKPLYDTKPFDTLYNRSEDFDALNGELYLDLKTYLVDDILVKVDRMSMATSLETRVPILDHKIVEFAYSLPGHLKLNGLTTKWIFKKSMERLLPHPNIYRKKEGFSIPIKHWLRTELKELMLDHLSAERIQKAGLFRFDFIKKMIDLHLKQRENFSHQLWALLVFEIWRENYLPSR
jgi:asparagine synthase (glutamine-hydrolysing)